jgi:hypothetical protein
VGIFGNVILKSFLKADCIVDAWPGTGGGLDIDGLVDGSMSFLFDDSIRTSPIPKHFQGKVKTDVKKKFQNWFATLAGDQLTNNFEIFKLAVHKIYEMVETETRRLLDSEEDVITFRYPKLPRKGDEFHENGKKDEPNKIVERYIKWEGGNGWQ